MKRILSLLISTLGFWQIMAAQNVAIKTNTLYWLTTTPNIGAEFSLSSKLTIEVAGAYNPWTFKDDKKMRFWLVQPELKYWTCENSTGTLSEYTCMAHNITGDSAPRGMTGTLPEEVLPMDMTGYYLRTGTWKQPSASATPACGTRRANGFPAGNATNRSIKTTSAYQSSHISDLFYLLTPCPTTMKTNTTAYCGHSLRKSARRNIQYLLISIATLPLLSSCIRDDVEPCPPLQVEISVKDKNYFNVDNVPLEARKSESLAFREYVPTLYYALRDASTGEIVEEQGVFSITGSEPTQSVTFCECLPFGKYVLTVWGGLADNTPLTDQSLTSILHANRTEANDIYLTHDTLVYDLQHTNYSAALQRVTGKLVIQITNPARYYTLRGQQYRTDIRTCQP